MDRQPITPDYATPADPQEREDAERHAAVERYNLATFGERRPIASAATRLGIAMFLAAAAAVFLPRPLGSSVALLIVFGYRIHEWWRDGRPR